MQYNSVRQDRPQLSVTTAAVQVVRHVLLSLARVAEGPRVAWRGLHSNCALKGKNWWAVGVGLYFVELFLLGTTILGLHVFGLQVFGLHAFGLRILGLHAFGLHVLGLRVFELHNLGLHVFGQHVLGLLVLGLRFFETARHRTTHI